MKGGNTTLRLLRAGAILAGLGIAFFGLHLGISSNWESEAGQHRFHENTMPSSVASFVVLGFLTILAVIYPFRSFARVVVPCLCVLAAVGHLFLLVVALSTLPTAPARVVYSATKVVFLSFLALLGLGASMAMQASTGKAAG